ncbi:MAG TPA: right-handed parallel beta-helix repeat-containing protein [Allosphingosinicella sp.]|jgi:hypothetical protein
MKLRTLSIAAAGIAAAAVFAAPAWAQATRTWVSGTGDDVNPCSRTAPCKTFAGAISKTAAGGEINCLDPGGYGAVTITKSMTISCPYTGGGVLAGGNGVTVNAGPNDVVFLRGLDIFGVNPPSNGVRFIAGAALHIEDSIIRHFDASNSRGVSFQPSGAAQLYITNTTIADNGSGATGGGILVQPTGSGSAKVYLNDVRVHNNANSGLHVDTTGSTGTAMVAMSDSVIAGNGNGISVLAPTGTAELLISGSQIVGNNTGIAASGSSTVRVGTTIVGGNATGILPSAGGTISSYGDNRVQGNRTDGSFSGSVQRQ